MKKEYAISGMSCGSCVKKVSDALNHLKEVEQVKIQLNYPQAIITSAEPLNLQTVNEALKEAGDYEISINEAKKELIPLPEIKAPSNLPKKTFETYRPLLLVIGFIAGVSLLVQYPFRDFSGMVYMRHFMAGFFLVFAFFKLLNLKGFANSYQMYDIITAKWKSWGYIYPFVELVLGILYLINVFPFETNILTSIILSVSSIGVIQSNLNKRSIKCACLGDVFNLPMSTVTIIENLSMVGMAIIMLCLDH